MNKLLGFVVVMACLSQVGYADPLDDFSQQKKEEKQQQVLQQAVENNEKARIADCKQAGAKAKARKQEILKELNLDKIHTPTGKVVGFAKDGIFIERTWCNTEWTGVGRIFTERCNSANKFIYGSTDYAENQTFNAEYIYQYAGLYKYTTATGATNQIDSYKKTKYKTSEIKYTSYLQNKSHECRTYEIE